MDNNTIDEQNAPRVSRVSLDELKNLRENNETQAVAGQTQSELNSDISNEENSASFAEIDNAEVLQDESSVQENATDIQSESVIEPHEETVEELNNNEQSKTESEEAETNGGDGEKHHRNNLILIGEAEDEDQDTETLSVSVSKNHNTIVSSEPVEYDDTNGAYTSNLDFTKNMSVSRYNLPKPKWPIFVSLGLIACIAVFVAVYYLIVLKPKPEVVVLSEVKFNVESVDSGYVGDSLDLRGVYIECTYSNGKVVKVYDIDGYITGASEEFDNNYKVVSAGDNGYVDFEYQGKAIRLSTVTHEYIQTALSIRIGQSNVFSVGNILTFNNILGFITYEGRGQRMMTDDEVKSLNAVLEINNEEYAMTKTTTGFVIPYDNVGDAKILFTLGELSVEVDVVIEL